MVKFSAILAHWAGVWTQQVRQTSPQVMSSRLSMAESWGLDGEEH